MSTLLVDVRSPPELIAAPLLPNAINIPFTEIASLQSTHAHLQPHSSITLYCRSGRRSAMARSELQMLGFNNVIDLGPYEEAERVVKSWVNVEAGEKVGNVDAKVKKEKLTDGLQALLQGLRDEEGT